MRVANALVASGALAVVYATARTAGSSPVAAAAGALFLGLSPAYQLSASLVRNDIVPVAFSALAVWAGVAATRAAPGPRPALWLACGLAFGLAVSAKISHAFLAASAGLFLLGCLVRPLDRRAAIRDVLAFAAGGLAGLVPTIISFALAPQAFLWGVVEYGASAPFDWYRSNGLDAMLGAGGKVRSTVEAIGRSPAVPALLVVGFAMIVGRRKGRPDLTFLDAIIVGGLVAALLPTPTWPYYFLTLLPVLFVRLATEIDRARGLRLPLVIPLVAIFAGSFLLTFNWQLRNFLASPWGAYSVPKVTSQAHWIAERMRASGAVGEIATLSPHLVIDSAAPIDRRFATGVFVYRSGHLLDPARHERFHTVGPQTIAGWFDRSQPAAIVVGDETRSDRFRIFPDDRLRAYAIANGYRLERSPSKALELYINPRRIRELDEVASARLGRGARLQPL
jgi:hypothetical protein